ncbi:cytochrome b/b6 domain-containing protein [Shewanella glacialipiscicola]|uniref:Cytochrome b561 n=1 Tax=Shewanella glacialipiscicola TaxID=614069 RepID=A0ABQ6J6F4_9GAMM|nr:cytochrome b/b6 domain-containing protein [Shewanella glacialipiscicola]MCL1085528.1 cytochrome b/b6 domain-containing protein [Shewanella glacialipiscicola]GIU04487.1 cytochrome b561 [Shewanella glacialipiscicola]GMA83713.1 cytochrome b561 [Shewanella glacialipiscicola]
MSSNTLQTIKVWDLLIRIFHWSLVGFFALAYLTEGEDEWMIIHSYAGYSILILLVFRLLWGVMGTHYARFSNFVTRPKEVLVYLKGLIAGNAKDYIGHNPAGAMMIMALIVSIAITGFSGMALYATDGHGPLATSFFATWPEGAIKEVHEFFANFTVFLVVIHVGGVIVSSLLHKENLVRAMLTGKKQRPVEQED